MTSTEDRMRANREVLAELTKRDRAAIAELNQLLREVAVTREVLKITRQAAGDVRTAPTCAGMGGGLIVALVGALVAVLLLRWQGYPAATNYRGELAQRL